MPNYRRRRVVGGTFFFTTALLNRSEKLLVDHIDALRASFRHVRVNHPFIIDVIVILPDHLHCIWTLPHGDHDFTTRWRLIKSHFSRTMPTTESRSQSRIRRAERGIWQRRFWEHAIFDEADYERHVEYIHYNRVKHGYVDRPIDWPHSSFHRYVARGVYAPTWCTCDVELAAHGES